MTDETLSEKEKLKLKVSFAEGYMVAANELKNSGGTVQSKVYVALKNIFFLVMIAFAMGFFSLGGKMKNVHFVFRDSVWTIATQLKTNHLLFDIQQ